MYSYESNGAGESGERGPQLGALPAAERLAADLDSFADTEAEHQSAELLIARFRSSLTSVQASELKRLFNRLPDLDEHSRQVIWQFADCLVAKIFHPPLECLRDASRSGSPQELLDDFQRLFQLDD